MSTLLTRIAVVAGDYLYIEGGEFYNRPDASDANVEFHMCELHVHISLHGLIRPSGGKPPNRSHSRLEEQHGHSDLC